MKNNLFAPGAIEHHKKPFTTPAQCRELLAWLRIAILAVLVALAGGFGAGAMSAVWVWIAPHLGPIAASAGAMLPVAAFLWALHYATQDTPPPPSPDHCPAPQVAPLSHRGRFWARYTAAISAALALSVLAAVLMG